MQELFKKHFNRLNNDLKQVQGYTPVMKVVISSALRELEDDIRIKFEHSGENHDTENNYDI